MLPIDYLNVIEALTRGIVEAAVREGTFQVFSDQEETKTPLQNAITQAAMSLKYWHYAGDGCVTEPSSPSTPPAGPAPNDPVTLQDRLLKALEQIDDAVFSKDWGYETPSPKKLIREGLEIARAAILEVPVRGADYLDQVVAALEAARRRQDACGVSNDGWNDGNGYILSGIGDACRAAEKLRGGRSS